MIAYRVSNVARSINVGAWGLVNIEQVKPVQMLDLWKSYKVLGAHVAVKRHQPSPIVFENEIAQVQHEELWWAPWSGVDAPEVHPRQMASAILVGDNWTSRYIRNCVPVGQRFQFNDRQEEYGTGNIVEFFKAGRPPWLPIDKGKTDNSGNNLGQYVPQQSCGFFYVDGPPGSLVKVDMELKIIVALRGRKTLGAKIDNTGPINPNTKGTNYGSEDIGGNLEVSNDVEKMTDISLD